MKAGTIPERRGELAMVMFAHDDWCRVHRNGYCNCDPDVYLDGVLIEVGAGN